MCILPSFRHNSKAIKRHINDDHQPISLVDLCR
nr:MAG TPA: hypothetical protein [Caudoviricetes sp.]